MSKKTILVLGASRYYSRSIAAARAAGYHVIAADKNPKSEGFASADVGVACDIVDRVAVLQLGREHRIDAIVPVNDYGVPTAAYVAKMLGILGISEESAHLATDKKAMRERWNEVGVPCPKVAVASTRAEFDRAVEIVGFPCILKPAHGIGGASRGVVVVRDAGALEEAIRFSQSFYADKVTLVEAFVDTELEHSAEVIISRDGPQVIAISDKVKTKLPYRVDKSVIYPTRLTGARRELLVETIAAAVRALDLNVGAAHVELASTDDGCVLFELGARCGGGGTPEPIVHFSTGVDEFVETVRVLAGDDPVNLVPTQANGSIYHFLTPPPGRVAAIDGVDEVKAMDGVLDAEVFVKPGDSIEPVTVGTQRAGFVITGAPTRDEALAIAIEAEKRIRITYA